MVILPLSLWGGKKGKLRGKVPPKLVCSPHMQSIAVQELWVKGSPFHPLLSFA